MSRDIMALEIDATDIGIYMATLMKRKVEARR